MILVIFHINNCELFEYDNKFSFAMKKEKSKKKSEDICCVLIRIQNSYFIH